MLKDERANELADRITNYLSLGGLFNPELASHGEVRELLFECRDVLSRVPKIQAEARAEEARWWAKKGWQETHKCTLVCRCPEQRIAALEALAGGEGK